jgi:alanyl-tRNA synthetase
LRRAIRYGFTFLDTKEPLSINWYPFWQIKWESFPEIKAQQQLVTNVIREEEASVFTNLDQGLHC